MPHFFYRARGAREPAAAFVIYLIHRSPHGFSILPSIVVLFFENGLSEQLSNDGLRELAASGRAQPTGRPSGWWALTPPSHPYRSTGTSQPRRTTQRRLFSSALSRCRQRLPLSEAERSMLPGLSSRPLPLSLHQHLTSRCNRGLAVNCEREKKGQRQTRPLPYHMQK